MTPKDTHPIPNWQCERAKKLGTARQRRAALAMFKPHSPDVGGSTPGGISVPPEPPGAATLPSTEHDMPTTKQNLKSSTANVENLQRMTLNLSPGFLMNDPTRALRDAIGKEKAPATIAGDMWGAITHGIRHPNNMDKEKSSIRWVGELGFRNREGILGEADSAYLPATVERKLLNAGAPVINENNGEYPPRGFVAEFSVQFVCEPYTPPPGKSGPPFAYACYNRLGRMRNINRLAPPEVQALLPPEEMLPPLLGYDPETGEIEEPAVEAEAAE